MPKGETSRPYNRKEKKAVKTKKAINQAGKSKSSTNFKTIVEGGINRRATATLHNRRIKADDRKYGKGKERITGRSMQTSVRVNSDGTTTVWKKRK